MRTGPTLTMQCPWLMTTARRIVIASVLALGAMHPVAAQAFELSDLARLRQAVAQGSARFKETRHVSMLNAPLERSGTLLYRRPDYLQMNVEKPRAEQLVISGRTLRLVTGGTVRTVALDGEPALMAWTESLRASLAGDMPALSRYFAATMTGTEGAWTLTLTPLDATLRAQISTIVISGAAAAITRIETHEAAGDDAVMDIVALPDRSP